MSSGHGAGRHQAHLFCHPQRDNHPVGKLNGRKVIHELTAAQAGLHMLAEAQGTFDLGGLAADGSLVGLKRAANRIEREMYRLVGVEERQYVPWFERPSLDGGQNSLFDAKAPFWQYTCRMSAPKSQILSI